MTEELFQTSWIEHRINLEHPGTHCNSPRQATQHLIHFSYKGILLNKKSNITALKKGPRRYPAAVT